MIPLGPGSFLLDSEENGKSQLKVFRAGLGLQNLLESSEQSLMPAVKIGAGVVAFRLVSADATNIAIASLRDGQIVKRFSFDASSVRSMAATPDGSGLYFCEGGQEWSIGTNEDEEAKPVRVTTGASVAIGPAGKYLYVVRARTEPRPLVRIPLAGGPAETLAIPPQYTISDDPLSSDAVDASGRVVFEVDSPDSWFERIALIDPSRKTFTVIPARFSGDIWNPGWESDGRVAATGEGLSSTMWRYKPSRSGWE